MSRATEHELGELQRLVAKVLSERIADGDICTAADINAAIKLLKDNNITATVEANEELGKLQATLDETDTSEADQAELDRALEQAGQHLAFKGLG